MSLLSEQEVVFSYEPLVATGEGSFDSPTALKLLMPLGSALLVRRLQCALCMPQPPPSTRLPTCGLQPRASASACKRCCDKPPMRRCFVIVVGFGGVSTSAVPLDGLTWAIWILIEGQWGGSRCCQACGSSGDKRPDFSDVSAIEPRGSATVCRGHRHPGAVAGREDCTKARNQAGEKNESVACQ